MSNKPYRLIAKYGYLNIFVDYNTADKFRIEIVILIFD